MGARYVVLHAIGWLLTLSNVQSVIYNAKHHPLLCSKGLLFKCYDGLIYDSKTC